MADSSQYNLSLVIKAQNEASKEIEKINWQVSSIWKTIWWLAISKTLLTWMKSFADEALTLWWNLEQAEIAFSTMLWSADEADKMLKDLSEFAKKTPFELTWIRDSAKQLMAYWFSAEEVLPTLKNLWDVASWLSVPISQLALPMWQVRVAWKLMTQDLKQFQNAWVDLVWELSKNLWKSKAEIQSMISSWKITSDMVAKAFETMTSEWWRFANLMEAQSWTYQWMMSNLNDSFDSIKETIWRTFIPILERVLSAIIPILDKISSRIEENPELATTIATVVAWAIALIWALSWLSAILPLITSWITLLTWPIWLVTWLIALLAVARFKDRWWIQEKTKETVDNISEIIWPRLEQIQAWRKENGEVVMIYVKEVMWAIFDTISTVLNLVTTAFALAFTWIQQWFAFFKAFISWDTEAMKQIFLQRVASVDQILTDWFGETRTNIKEWVQWFVDDVIAKFNELKDKVMSIVKSIKNAWDSAKQKVSGWWEVAETFITWKAWWWTVYWNTPYLVWEHWPELFIPSQRWSIEPTNQITNNNWIEINISWVSVRNDSDIQNLAEEIARRIKLEKNYGII